MIRRYALLSTLLLAGALPAAAQPQAKKPLDHDVYEIWNRITEQAVSDDGRWALFSLSPEDGDAELRVKSLTSDQAYRVPRGVSARFSEEGRYAAFQIKPAKEAVRHAKREKKKPDEMPQDSLGILDLSTGDVTRLGPIKSFKMPEDAGGYLAYHLENTPTEKDTTTVEEAGRSEEDDRDKKKEKVEGTPLVLRNLASGAETRFDNVAAYLFSEDGR
jgi:hypothetical protein